MLFLYLFLLILGLVVGSFLGMLSFRLPRGVGVWGRSFCDSCSSAIPWYQNIPVLSYFLLRGRCAKCQQKISGRYPVIEGLTGFSFVLAGYLHFSPTGLGVPLTFSLFLIVLFIALAVTDAEYRILPDELLLVLAAGVILFLLTIPSPALFVNLFWGFLVFVFFLALYLLTGKRGMGFGDVKLSFILGSMLGFPQSLVWLFLAFLTAAAGGLVLMALGRARIGRPISFGPYLLVSSLASLFAGELIFSWYAGMF